MAARAVTRRAATLAQAVLLGAFGALALAPASAIGAEPLDLSDADRPAGPVVPTEIADRLREIAAERAAQATPAPAPSPRPNPSDTPEPSAEPATRIGFDVSYPQCGSELPDEFAFAIVGVNGGRVLSENPCLGPSDEGVEGGQGAEGVVAGEADDGGGDGPLSLLEWAGPDAQLYMNTGNPGPRISRHWPEGIDEPRDCAVGDGADADSLDCAYVYGWNAAGYAHEVALEAYIGLGWAEEDAERLPGEVTWWLDVETANSWRGRSALNVAALQGAVDHLEHLGAAEIGFYSTPRMWQRITGGTDAFAEHPAWHAGARDEADAEERCEHPAFTGGELRMVQWVEDGLDHNIRCE